MIALPPMPPESAIDPHAVAADLRRWAGELGFSACGIAPPAVGWDEERLMAWLRRGHQAEMAFMGRHGRKRARPRQLVPGTRSVVVVRLDYAPQAADPVATLRDRTRGYVARYALGRDYHRLMRRRLQRLAERLSAAIGPFGYRAFVDSAPVLERALAREAGLGWIGKNTMLLNRRAGSLFFLGELFTDLALPTDAPAASHCGSCRACLAACPTGALVGPYQLDARRCIGYLTVEHPGPIPEALRPAVGNRIFGCDDCLLACPWNRQAPPSAEDAFQPRHGLDAPALAELFRWDEATFRERTAGSPIRRLGYERWSRNLAVALGNAPATAPVLAALQARRADPSALVREHVAWALARLGHL